MSENTLKLQLWSNFNTDYSQRTNVGDSWVIDPAGLIIEPISIIDATPSPGVLKIYKNLHPDCLVIHWIFPNIHVGHILWISRAPLRLADSQITAVRTIEHQLAKDWERITRREFNMLTPPQFNTHWDLEKYTLPFDLPVACRGRKHNEELTQISRDTIEHYANLLENRKHEFTDLGLSVRIDRNQGIAYYTGRNGGRAYPLDQLGYHSICRALGRVRAYRRNQQ